MQLESKDDVHTLTLWLAEVFDESYYFRGALSVIEGALGDEHKVRHELPARLKLDDFVEGRLLWGSRVFELCWERPLGYMQFSSRVRADTQALQEALAASGSIE